MALYKQLATTNQVKVGAGKLFGIFVSSTTSGTLAVYDSATADTNDPKIANTITVTAGAQYLSFPAGMWFSKGLYVVAANTIEFTVVYE
ncbi:MAG: hypothetical protein EHM17_00290 [Verrucomicrobiaceae bacterium]|nr:MAG: hypothetical protein EHM17_14340 [Verrucomicrobiaceae bacterium]RPJ33337.1 MAG: hypothetical protein EHM17_10700 [Verrucomicrobiaceae bacterium]RPJ36033.1 MAG: hypothetical protein EHM17_00290 [Verrucomicrobiaceae bacterium]